MVTDSGVNTTNNRDDTPLLVVVGTGKLEPVGDARQEGCECGDRQDGGAGLLDIVSHQTELLNLTLTCSPEPKDWNTKTLCLYPN